MPVCVCAWGQMCRGAHVCILKPEEDARCPALHVQPCSLKTGSLTEPGAKQEAARPRTTHVLGE